MRYKSAILASDAAHTTKYAQAAVAALVVALILSAFVAPFGVAAQVDPIQRGIDAGSERYQAMALAAIERGIEAGSLRWVALGKSLTGIERGIAAGSERYQAMALAGIERGIEAGSLRWVALGKSLTGIERGIAAGSERYQAMALAGIERGIEASSARLQAMGLDYLAKAGDGTPSDLLAAKFRLDYAQYRGHRGGAETNVLAENPELLLSRRFSSTLPYTDVSKFYAERMRVLAHQNSTNTLAENPELLLSRSFSPKLPYTDVHKFYAERMRVLAHGGSAVACTLDKDYATLAANPELVYAAQAEKC